MSQQLYQQSLMIPTHVDSSHERHTQRHPHLGFTALRYFHAVALAYLRSILLQGVANVVVTVVCMHLHHVPTVGYPIIKLLRLYVFILGYCAKYRRYSWVTFYLHVKFRSKIIVQLFLY